MADNCVGLTFLGIFDDAFYFDSAEDELDCDTFEYTKTLQKFIRCSKSRYLIFNGQQFVLEDLINEQRSPDTKLDIKIYKHHQSISGVAAVLSARKEDKMYRAVCKGGKVVAEEITVKDLESPIESTQHEAVFYMEKTQKDTYKFTSSQHQDKCLGFDENDSNKLILCDNDSESQMNTFRVY